MRKAKLGIVVGASLAWFALSLGCNTPAPICHAPEADDYSWLFGRFPGKSKTRPDAVSVYVFLPTDSANRYQYALWDSGVLIEQEEGNWEGWCQKWDVGVLVLWCSAWSPQLGIRRFYTMMFALDGTTKEPQLKQMASIGHTFTYRKDNNWRSPDEDDITEGSRR